MNELSPIGNFLRVVPSATVTFLGPAEKTFNIRKLSFSSHTSGEVVSEPKHLTNPAQLYLNQLHRIPGRNLNSN